MASVDFETKLDEALKHLTKGMSDQASRQMPEASDLINVAQRLQALRSAPQPDLNPGRERFMTEAARLGVSPRKQTPAVRALPRPILAFLTAFILLAGGTVFVAVRTSMSASANTPSPTTSPTLTGTPTNAAFEKSQRLPALPTRSNSDHSVRVRQPEPAPTPRALRAAPMSYETIILDWRLLNG